MDNIILIDCDDLGYRNSGCCSSMVNRTPAPDEMARKGMRCTGFYASLAVDERLGIAGTGVRMVGQTNSPGGLTAYDPGHPYMAALYDKADRG